MEEPYENVSTSVLSEIKAVLKFCDLVINSQTVCVVIIKIMKWIGPFPVLTASKKVDAARAGVRK